MSKQFTPTSLSSCAERFWSYVQKTETCWIWTGYKEKSGYGRFKVRSISNSPLLAHRVACELTLGPMPEGLFACHHCDNPSCVNPAHIFFGTNKENLADMRSKGRGNVLKPRTVLTDADVEAIRQAYSQGHVTQKELGRTYNVCSSHICNIIKRNKKGRK